MGDSKQGRSKLGELLIAAGELKPQHLESALEEQRNWGGFLGFTLVRMGFVDEQTVIRTLAQQLNLPIVQLRGKRINSEVLELVSVDLAEKHRCLPLLVNGEGADKVLYLGMDDPSAPNVVTELSNQVGMKVQPVLVAQTEMDEAIQRHYHWADFDGGSSNSLPADSTAPSEIGSSAPEFEAEAPALADGGVGPLDSEPEIVDIHQLAPEPEKSQAIYAPSPLASVASNGEARGSPGGSSDPMLRALAQLLVEKGVITRNELVERLQEVLKPKPGS